METVLQKKPTEPTALGGLYQDKCYRLAPGYGLTCTSTRPGWTETVMFGGYKAVKKLTSYNGHSTIVGVK